MQQSRPSTAFPSNTRPCCGTTSKKRRTTKPLGRNLDLSAEQLSDSAGIARALGYDPDGQLEELFIKPGRIPSARAGATPAAQGRREPHQGVRLPRRDPRSNGGGARRGRGSRPGPRPRHPTRPRTSAQPGDDGRGLIVDRGSAIALVLAGGTGRRMGRPKQFIELLGMPALHYTLRGLRSLPRGRPYLRRRRQAENRKPRPGAPASPSTPLAPSPAKPAPSRPGTACSSARKTRRPSCSCTTGLVASSRPNS